MKDYEVLQNIKASGVCAIVRGTSPDSLCKIAEALIAGGVKAIEVTFNTPGADEMIKELVKKYGNELMVGAGTVLDPETAKVAIAAGAQFILSPSLNLEVMRICQRYSVLPVPGVCTPTEILTAWENGAQVVKIFPAGALGASYIKQVKGPFNHIDMMVVGGINVNNIGEYVKAGACSAGIGSELVDKKLVAEGRFDEITARAKAFIDAFKAV
jgi:2-dehydro-3-deoxyphosphogluconate aldolase/(4S)-4-hydroxy-2-oxoglutarate aldolase